MGYAKREGMPPDAVDWYGKVLDHNTPGGKLNRGMSVVDSVEILKGSALDEEEYRKAAILGWLVELLQAFFLVADDIMDQSITRRGQPCWYKMVCCFVVRDEESSANSQESGISPSTTLSCLNQRYTTS